MIAEAASHVVILAMRIGSDGAADGDELGSRRDRRKPPAGRAWAMTSAKLTPLSHSSTPEPGSSSILPPALRSRMVPVGCNALSP